MGRKTKKTNKQYTEAKSKKTLKKDIHVYFTWKSEAELESRVYILLVFWEYLA